MSMRMPTWTGAPCSLRVAPSAGVHPSSEHATFLSVWVRPVCVWLPKIHRLASTVPSSARHASEDGRAPGGTSSLLSGVWVFGHP